MSLSGSCSCGAVKYQLKSAPMFVHCCHCHDCQRQTGSAFVLNALIEADRVEATGETEAVSMPTDSGRAHDIYSCPKCKIALWSTYGGRTAIHFVRVGTLDDPSVMPPDVHIFTRSKLPWVTLPEGAHAFEVYYDSSKLWSAESLARRKAVMS
ncbi:MAG TPA: GFA family protein [Rhizomicrobium sp.]